MPLIGTQTEVEWGAFKQLLLKSMVTVGQLVNSADLPQERKDPVKQVLLHLGVPASRTVGKAFRSLNEKHLTDHGLSIADAVAIFAESAPTTDIAVNMGNQQQVCVQIEDGRSYPVMLYDGRLDVDAVKEQLANDNLLLTRLDGIIPSCDRSGMSRAAFTGDIRGQTKMKKGLKSAKAYPSAKGHWWTSSLMH